ncbi:hypothetical protein PYW07_010605 [Mythimna separata]|uniref:Peptidase S1 domain-containing protein n=1 Tax=Mythimna separata TaxID=271217 RepID=A0AAD8DMG5_MYTSE|nr:hypothetical protein PYW07_010605 [Mythimna separata]
MDKFLFLFIIVFCVTKASSSYEEPNETRRITAAVENQFPYMVSLQELSKIHDIHTTLIRGHRCGGVLVTLQHALTAASCFLQYNSSQHQYVPIDRDEYRVFAGSVSLTNDSSSDRVRRIANTTAHPEFNAPVDWNLHNIGIIILGSPFLRTTVASISIRDIGNPATYVQCTGMGWQRGTRLMYNTMMAFNDTMCSRLTQSVPNTLCAWPGTGVGCVGEEGSPLVCQDHVIGVYIIISPCTSTSLGAQLFVRASRYTTWINTVIALPIPELGPEPSTVPPPTTTTTAAPGAAFMFQPGMTLLAVMVVAQTIRASFIN